MWNHPSALTGAGSYWRARENLPGRLLPCETRADKKKAGEKKVMEKNLQNFHLLLQKSGVWTAGPGEHKHLSFQKLVKLLPSNSKHQNREVSTHASPASPSRAPVCVTASSLPTYAASLYEHFLWKYYRLGEHRGRSVLCPVKQCSCLLCYSSLIVLIIR